MLTLVLLAATLSFPADPLRPGLLASGVGLVAREDTVQTWSIVNGVRRDGRPFVWRLWREGAKADARWCVERTYTDSTGAVTTRQYAEAVSATLAPVRIRTQSPTDSCDVRIEYGHLTGYVSPARKPRRELAQDVSAEAFAHGFTPLVLAAQRLHAGWHAKVTDIEPYRDGDAQFAREARVVRRESLDLNGEPVDCWVVELGEPGNFMRTHWVSVQTHRLLQMSGRSANGSFTWYERVRGR